MWHDDKYKITFKLVISSRRIFRGSALLIPGPVPGRGLAVEKHCSGVPPYPVTEAVWIELDFHSPPHLEKEARNVSESSEFI
jgi:hypothetical protein